MQKSIFITLVFIIATLFQACSPVEDSLSDPDRPAGVESPLSSPLQFKKLPIGVKITPVGSPPRAHIANSFEMKFWDTEKSKPEGTYSDPGYEIYVKLWMRMPSGDHGSAPVVINVSRDNTGNRIPGVYRIDQARFTMKGKWEIQIKLLEDGQVVDEVIQYVSI